MSSVGHHDVSDKGKEKKVDPQATIQLQNPSLVGPNARFHELLQNDLLKAASLSKHAAPIRTIAPAPGLAMSAASANKIISQHALVSKTGLGNALETISLQPSAPAGSQTVAVNLSTQVAPISQAASQALHITMTTVSSQSLHSLTLPAALGHTSGTGLVQAQTFSTQVPGGIDIKDKSRVAVMAPGALTDQDRVRNTMSMASLIRGAVSLPQGLPQTHTQVSLALAQAQGHTQGIANPSQASIIHALPPSHIPRGPAAASALAAAKAGPVATPMLRPQSSVAQLPSNNALLPTIAAQKQPRAPFTVRPATPPVTQMGVMTTTHNQAEIHRQAQGHMMTTLSGTSPVQISGLQGLGAGLQGRPVLSHVTNPKGSITVSQPGLPQGFSTPTQKVVVSQSQLLTSGQGGPTLVTVPNPKLQGSNLALNLAPQVPTVGAVRTQKILATQVQSLPTQTQGSLTVGGPQTMHLGQQLARPPKVIVTHAQSLPPGAVVVNTTSKLGPQALSQALARPQKVLMSNMPSSITMPTTVPITIANLPKTITGVGVHSNPIAQISSMSGATNVATTSSIASIPFNKRGVKVQSQRTNQPQVAMTASQHPQQVVEQSLQVQSLQAHRDMSASPQVRLPLAQGAALSASQSQIQASLFGMTGSVPRPPSSSSQGNLAVAVATSTQATTQAPEVRNPAQDRPNIAQHMAFPVPEYSMPQANYYAPYNLVYQQHTLPAGSAIRPTIVPGQHQANLAATLQAATQAVTTVTGSQPGVRINPSVMVSVDPAHHSAISMATAQFAGSKPAEVPQLSTTTVSMAPTGVSAHPASIVQTSVSHVVHTANQQPGSINSQPTNASPRPSILRKRPHEGGERVMIVKRNLLSSVNAADTSNSSTTDSFHHLSNTTSPKPSVPCDPMRENSQSSTDTASSAESTPQSGVNSEVKVKQEPLDAVENGAAASLAMFGQLQNNIEASPRKKPRKQRLHASEELKDGGSSDEELDKLAEEDIKKELEWMTEDFIRTDMKEYVDEEGVRWTRDRRRPPVNLMNHYTCNWKARNNHYQKHQDVKAKEERRPTVNELANQKSIHQKASGWKVYHLAAQLEELMDMERDVFRSMSSVQECIAPKHIAKNPTMEDDISMVHELTQGNIQRCQLVMDQLDEAKSSMVKVLDHKQRIVDIINKHHSKRPVKKKERP